jgi:His-Xaa-Ser repeat protein HxsA
MTIRRFVIPSLFAAGFGAHDPAQATFTRVTTTGADDPNNGTLFRLFRQDHYVTLAQHRSHSSHSSHSSGGSGHYSHSSHTSHRSSTGGYGPYPAPAPAPEPVYSPPPPPPPPASTRPRATPPSGSRSPITAPGNSSRAAAPPVDGLPVLSGRSQRFTAIVRRVQIALMGQGYFDGPITGTVGPGTRNAIRHFQAARSLSQTGTITPELLDALMISSE